MGFNWSLNPYMGCVHRCTFCYVRAFERRADRPSDDRYGRSIRVKTNVAEVLRRELARPSWERETVAIGAATDPYQPAEGRYRLTRALPRGAARRGEPVRHHHARAADRPRRRRARRGGAARRGLASRSRCRRSTRRSGGGPSPATAHPRQRLRALKALVDAGVKASVGHGADPARHLRPAGAARARSCAPPARRAPRRLGEPALPRPARASTSSTHSPQDWPEELARYERLYAPRAPTSAPASEAGARARSPSSRGEHGIRDRRPVRLDPCRRSPSSWRWRFSRMSLSRPRSPTPNEITCLIVDDHEVVREDCGSRSRVRRTSA